MTATRLNPKINDLLVVEEYSSGQITVNGSSDTYWEISKSKSGYTPIAFTPMKYGWSSTIVLGIEGCNMNSGSFFISGFARRHSTNVTVTPTITVKVLWVKN